MNKKRQQTCHWTFSHLYVNVLFAKSLPNVNNFNQFYNNLKNELTWLQKQHLLKVKTIYLGGSTLANINNQELKQILNLFSNLDTNILKEYSIELYDNNFVNDIRFAILKSCFINRIVWKVGSFNEHLASKWQNSGNKNILSLIKKSLNFGFDNYGVDLLYNIKNQTEIDLIQDLNTCLRLKVPHISYQSATDNTNFLVKTQITQSLLANKYQNYEIHSYCRANKYQSQQTIAYLRLANWYGLGPKAGGFYHQKFSAVMTNKPNMTGWKLTTEILTIKQYQHLFLCQGLSLKKGIKFTNQTIAQINYYYDLIISLINGQRLIEDHNQLRIKNFNDFELAQIINLINNY